MKKSTMFGSSKALRAALEDASLDPTAEGGEGTEQKDAAAPAEGAAAPAAAPTPGTGGAAAAGAPAEGGAAPAAPAEGEAAPAADASATPAADAAPAEGGDAAPATGSAEAPAGSAADAPAPGGENTAGTNAEVAAADASADAGTASEVEADRVEGEEIGVELAQADKQATALEGLLGEVTMLGRAAVGLENLGFQMAATKDFGGPNAQTAIMYRAAVESLCDIIETTQPITPALEEADKPAARIDGADKAAKNNGNLVQRIMATMRAGLARAAEWIKGAWKFMSSARARTLARAKKMQEGLASAKFITEKVGGGLANSVKNTGEFVGQMEKFAGLTQHFAQPQTYSSYIKVMELGAELVAQAGQSSDDRMQAVDQALSAIGNEFAKGMTEGKSDDAEVLVYEAPAVAGSVVKITVPVKFDKIGKFGAVVTPPDSKDAKKVEQVDPVNQGQATQLLNSIVATLEMVEKTTDENGLKGVDDKLNAATARFKNGGQVPADPDGRVAKAMQKVASLFASRAKLPVYAVARAYVATANTALSLIAASYGEKAADPAADKGEAPAAGAAGAAAA